MKKYTFLILVVDYQVYVFIEYVHLVLLLHKNIFLSKTPLTNIRGVLKEKCLSEYLYLIC
jgi:hypothetical protein